MQVSVIIPVYRAEAYVEQAVKSALEQSETAEVLLIEDGSPDKSLQVCENLTHSNPKVKLLRHADGKNHGAAASRNIGLTHACSEYVSFLDADDYMQPERYAVARELFAYNPKIEGVYEATGVFFEDDVAERVWYQQRSGTVITMIERVAPDELFEKMGPIGGAGTAHISGWVVKKTVFDKVGYFDEHLPPHEDTAMLIKFSAMGHMVPGQLDKPVTMRRIHGHNTIFAPRAVKVKFYKVLLMWYTLWRWGQEHLPPQRQQIVLNKLLLYAARPYQHKQSRYLINRLQAVYQLLDALWHYPQLAKTSAYWSKLFRCTGILSLTRTIFDSEKTDRKLFSEEANE